MMNADRAELMKNGRRRRTVRLRREAYGISESFCVALEVWSVSFSRTARRFSWEGRREREERQTVLVGVRGERSGG